MMASIAESVPDEKLDIAGAASIFFVMATGFLLPISTAGVNIVLPLAVIASVFAGDFKRHRNLVINNPIVWALLGFLATYLIGASYTIAPLDDVLVSLRKVGKLLYLPLLLPMFSCPRKRKTFFYAFIIAVFITGILGAAKFFFNLDIGSQFTSAAVFKSHIQTNFLMASTVYLLMVESETYTQRMRILVWVVVAIMTYYIWFLSPGRSGYIIYIVLMLFYSLQRYGFRSLFITFLLSIMLFYIAYGRMHEAQQDYEHYLIGNANSSVGQRIGFFSNTKNLIFEKPFLGWGTGSFKQVYAQKYGTSGPLATRNPHNEYAMIASQLGLMGIIALFTFFSVAWYKSCELPDKSCRIARAVILAISIGSLANSWLSDVTEGLFFAVFLAFCFAAATRSFEVKE